MWEHLLTSGWTWRWWSPLRWPVIFSLLRDFVSPWRCLIPPRPYRPNPSAILVHLRAVTLHLRHPDLKAVGFVLEAASADLYLSRAHVYTVAFQWGFAEWIGETHLNRGLKLQACSDALIATVSYLPLLFCVSWEWLFAHESFTC